MFYLVGMILALKAFGIIDVRAAQTSNPRPAATRQTQPNDVGSSATAIMPEDDRATAPAQNMTKAETPPPATASHRNGERTEVEHGDASVDVVEEPVRLTGRCHLMERLAPQFSDCPRLTYQNTKGTCVVPEQFFSINRRDPGRGANLYCAYLSRKYSS